MCIWAGSSRTGQRRATAALPSQEQGEVQDASSRTKPPSHRGHVDFPAPAFPSQSLQTPDQRDTWLEREAGTYLRLRRVRLAQRAPISAATPLSLMELLCRLKTEERAHLAWLSQDPEGAISPAQTLSWTGSWGYLRQVPCHIVFSSSPLFPLSSPQSSPC